MTKPWPQKLAKKDVAPDDYLDLSVETQRLVAHGDHVYFFLWCWDMEEADQQQSILFRVHRSFDQPGERLASIKSEMVNLCLYNDQLVALESGSDNKGGFGAVHFVKPGAGKPTTTTRFEEGSIFNALSVGPNNTLFAAGVSIVQRFDGKKWKAFELPDGVRIKGIGSNGKIAVAVGGDSAVVALDSDGPRVVAPPTKWAADFASIDIAADGQLAIAGDKGQCRQGTLETLAPVEGLNESAVFCDTCLFKGKRYWSAAGDSGIGGLYVQNGKKLELIFEDQNCFALTPTDDYLFIASEAGILRFDGKEEFKPVSTDYDEDKSIWVMLPGEPKEAEGDDDDDDGDE